ncbi:uncharacterized protein LOC123524712 [Mercenaria mercenaria]|uniref:uncharacterized protein LOC123524712 n=1 Tax=Mercenaria mercenaria TaxID=6596 RepID=UPI00234EA68A|nr:uncharacterized protein LOC123524712 [Mercenaria mercenaria]
MENYSGNKNTHKESGTNSLSEVLTTEEFPIVARISKTNELAGNYSIENKEVLFQRRLKTRYAQVRILDFKDKQKSEEEKGIDFIMEHDNFVDDNFLIPVKYNGTLKFIHRPGSRMRYASILQVLKELPRFLLVGEDTVAMPSNGIGKNIIVPAKTILEVVRKYNADGETYLQCSDGHDSYAFSEKDRVNFTGVEDEKSYHLFELVRLKLLPQVFQFKDVDPTDIILANEELNSGLLTMACGPMELLRFVDVDIIVGWLRDNRQKTYETLIIPSNLWPMIQLQTRAFPDQKGKHNYIERKFRHCIHTDFVERSLYIISMDQSEITWLRSPDFYERNYSGSSMYDVVHIDFQDSSEDENEANGKYTEIFDCPPPIPERPTMVLDPQVPTHLLPEVKEKMSVYEKAHKELSNWFTPKSKQKKTKRKKRKDSNSNIQSQKKVTNALTPNKISRCSSESDARDGIGAKHNTKQLHGSQPALDKNKFHSVESVTEETSLYLHPDERSTRLVSSDENIRQKSPTSPNLSISKCSSQTPSGANSDFDELDSDSSHDYNYPVFEAFVSPPPDALHDQSETDSSMFPAAVQDSEPKSPSRNIIERDATASVKEHSVQGENLPEENFYRCSVFETSQCFRHCGMEEFADECFKNRLDGSFFKSFDLQELKGDPFHLSNFHVLKVRKIIYEGWRPSNGNN